MSYDLKITGGTLVDGTGAPRRQADVAVRDGLIVAVGDCPGAATRTIDATGLIVTPGWTDIHTHYDGQVTWDEELAPSCYHGVTTAVMGSCGVGFAPVRPTDHARLIELMEGVEDIPGSALAEGIDWRWESFPEYMDALDAMPHTIDFACLVPHDPLRVFVMGERAVHEEDATPEDLAQMQQLLSEALKAGAAYRMTDPVDYEPPMSASLHSEATAKGEPVLSVFYDALLEEAGHALLYFPIYNYLGGDLSVVHTMLSHPQALPGLSDGGAHVGTVCDASFPTFMLTHWARDRKDGFPLEKVVQMMSSDTSSFMGMSDRGTVQVGMKADLNVIDFDGLTLRRPRIVSDLPAGGQRMLQDAEGYVATIVSGTVLLENGVLTGARPGRLVRLK